MTAALDKEGDGCLRLSRGVSMWCVKVDYYVLPYTAATAKAKNYCLKGQIGYYDAELSGTWAP